MNLIVNAAERDDLQCVVEENGIRCIHGVRNLARQYCNMHYSRWQRTGTVLTQQKNQRKALSAQRKVEMMRKEGVSDSCMCIHSMYDHNQQRGCHHPVCRCRSFSGANHSLLRSTLETMENIGFSSPLNHTALCRHCDKYISVGHWTDSLAIQRMRNHAKEHYVPGRFRRAG